MRRFILAILVSSTLMGCAPKSVCYRLNEISVKHEKEMRELKAERDKLQKLVWGLSEALDKCQGTSVDDSKYDLGVGDRYNK